MQTQTCPSREELSALAAGKLRDADIDRVADHLDDCPDCRRSLADLEATHDTLVAGVRVAAGATALTLPPSFQRALEEAAATFDGPERLLRGRVESPDLGRIRDYQLLSKLGEGGMGAVYEALHTNLKRRVAIKVLPTDRVKDPEAVARFHREMEAVGKLVHPNIVLAHDAGQADDRHFLVMEYVDGVDLSVFAKRHGPLAMADACELVRQAALGLDFAHRHGLVHRDVKPSNLMLSRDGQLKILDLGLALLQQNQAPGDELTATGQTMGTADYLAPEQVTDSHHVDIRADIYSLGCTLFNLLTGAPPYRGPEFDTIMKKMVAHLQAPVPRLRARWRDAPAELDALLARMMAKSPSDRPASAAAVAAALAPFAVGSDLPRLAADWVGEGLPVTSPLAAPEVDTHQASAASGTDPYQTVPESVQGSGFRAQTAETPDVAEAIPHSARRIPHSILPPRWRKRRVAISAAGAAAAVILAGIVIVITNDRGEQTTIAVPGAKTLDIQNDAGQTLAKIDTGATAHPVTSRDANRRAAQWALDRGCTVGIEANGKCSVLQPTELLPSEPFKLRSIQIGGNKQITDDDVKVLAGTSDLDRLLLLELESSQVTDAALEHISKLKGLEQLNLINTKVTDAGLHHLRDLPKLQHLSLAATRVTDWGLEEVVKIETLKSLAIYQTAVTDDGLVKIGGLPNLESLALNTTHITDDGLRRLDLDLHGPQGTGIGKLKELSISNNNITDQGVELIAKCQKLTNLDLAYTKITEKSLEHLKSLRRLTHLRIEHVNITPAALARLQAALPECRIESELLASPVADPDRRVAEWALRLGAREVLIESPIRSVASINDLPSEPFQLRHIVLWNNEHLTDAALAEIGVLLCSLPKLTWLDLSGTKITDAGLVHLLGATSLEALFLHNTEISDTGLASLAALGDLRRIGLGSTKIGDAGLKHLRGMAKLETIELWGTRVSDWGVQDLMELKNLREVIVYSTVLGDEGLARLTALPKLEMLWAGATRITDDGLAALSGMPTLKQLVINHTRVTDEGLVHVAKMRNLSDLNLLHTRVTDKGLEHLKNLRQLRRLSLRETRATEAGVLALQTALPTCKIESDLLTPKQLAAASVLAVGGTLQVRTGDQDRNVRSLADLPDEKFQILTIGLEYTRPPADDALLRRLGDLPDVNGLGVTGSVITDASMATIARMTRLEGLTLASPNLTDEGIQHLANLRELTHLFIGAPRMTDALVPVLQQLPKLRRITLAQTAITDAGVEQLAGLSSLEHVALLECPAVTDRALEHLARLGELERLSLFHNSGITDAGLGHLATMRKLKQLDLFGSGVTAQGLAHLRGLPALEYLRLSESQLPEADMEPLKALPNLKTLDLLIAQVDAARVAALQAALPNCKIEWSGK